MAVSVLCPGCRTSYPVADDLLGKKIRCKKCQETFTAAAARNGHAGDERITTRPAARTVRDDDDEPRNGRARPAAKSGGNKGLLIGGAVGGVLFLVMAGVTIWALSRKTDDTTSTASNTAPPVLPLGNTTPNVPVVATTPDKGLGPAAGEEPKGVASPGAFAGIGKIENQSQPRVRTPDFRADVVERVKQSAVMIQCDFAEGSGDGSGWVAEPNGIIVTNAHVVGMKEAAKAPPQKIEVVVYPGVKGKEARYTAKILALDRDEDLAVLQIKARDLPEPLPIAPSFELVDGQKLMTLGFPLGRMLKRAVESGNEQEVNLGVKARFTTVAGRFRNKDGSIKYIQVEGGVDGGNSGGAVVDTSGHVVAVVVAEMRGTNIKFVIPSEYAVHLLQGRIQRLIPGQAVRSGGSVRQPLTCLVADPMKRLASISGEVWTGPKPNDAKGELNVRPAAEREPSAMSGDAGKVSFAINYRPDAPVGLGEAHAVTAEVNLPNLPAGHVYWFRPRYKLKDGKDRWGEAMVIEMGRHPVDQGPANLTMTHKADSERRLQLDSRATTSFETETGFSGARDLELVAQLAEKTRTVERNGDAKVRLQYVDLAIADKDLDSIIRRMMKGVLESVKGLKAEVTVTKDGRMRNPTPDFVDVPSRARTMLRSFNNQIVDALENVAVPLPNKEVQPGETWNVDTNYTVLVTQPPQNALFRMTCKYVGTRVRDGRREAVIEMTGRIVRGENNRGTNPGSSGDSSGGSDTPSGDDGPGSRGGGRGRPGSSDEPEGEGRRSIAGVARGAAVVDLETGYIVLSRLYSDLAIELRINDNQRAHAGLTLQTTLRRSLTKDAPKPMDLDALLPNQPRIYKPMVGAIGGDQVVDVQPLPSGQEARTADIKPEVSEAVRKKAVFIDVAREDGGGSGSGWLAEPNGIVVTNSHVVGMVDKAKRPPESITVVLHQGTPKETKYPAKILALDRENDLAVLKIEATGLPEPFQIKPSEEMVEGHTLSVVGFPRGKSLAAGAVSIGATDLNTEVKIRSTRVSGRFSHADGSTKWVQIEGGADPGNSGGPVVDSEGNVRTILVAGIPGTQIVWTIPAEYAARMLQGYPMEVKPGRSFLDGSVGVQPIEIVFADPLKRVTKVAVDVWVGADGKPRPGTEKEPKVVGGDGPRQTVELVYDPATQTAKGQFPLPEKSAGQVYWLQPRFTNGTGKPQWSRAIVYAPDGPPVRKQPADLFVRHKLGAQREVEVMTEATFRYNQMGEMHVEGFPLRAVLTEQVVAVTPRKAAKVHLQYKDLDLDWKIRTGDARLDTEIRRILRQIFRDFFSQIRGVVTVVTVSEDGVMRSPQADYRMLPLQAWVPMMMFNNQLTQSLSALSLKMPNKRVSYGDTWNHSTNFFVETRSRYESSLFDMKFTYVGVRDRGGREEAVVEIEGTLAKSGKAIEPKDLKEKPKEGDAGATPPVGDGAAAPPGGAAPLQAPRRPAGVGPSKGLYGMAKGYALVDVATGTVTEVKMLVDLDVEIVVKDKETKQDVPVMAGGVMDLHLKRSIVAPGR